MGITPIEAQALKAPPSIESFSVHEGSSVGSLDDIMASVAKETKHHDKKLDAVLKSDLRKPENLVVAQNVLIEKNFKVGFVANVVGKLKTGLETLMKQQ